MATSFSWNSFFLTFCPTKVDHQEVVGTDNGTEETADSELLAPEMLPRIP